MSCEGIKESRKDVDRLFMGSAHYIGLHVDRYGIILAVFLLLLLLFKLLSMG